MSLREGKYINPLSDFGFKKLFGTEPNKVLLIDFLNHQEGREKGRQEGREQGRRERNIEVAKSSKNNGVPTELIIQATGLSKIEIKNFKTD